MPPFPPLQTPMYVGAVFTHFMRQKELSVMKFEPFSLIFNFMSDDSKLLLLLVVRMVELHCLLPVSATILKLLRSYSITMQTCIRKW